MPAAPSRTTDRASSSTLWSATGRRSRRLPARRTATAAARPPATPGASPRASTRRTWGRCSSPSRCPTRPEPAWGALDLLGSTAGRLLYPGRQVLVVEAHPEQEGEGEFERQVEHVVGEPPEVAGE